MFLELAAGPEWRRVDPAPLEPTRAESPTRRLARVRRARSAHHVRGATDWSRAAGARSPEARVALRRRRAPAGGHDGSLDASAHHRPSGRRRGADRARTTSSSRSADGKTGAMERSAERVLARARARLRHGADRLAPALPACARRLARGRGLETIRRARTGARRHVRPGGAQPVGRASCRRRTSAGWPRRGSRSSATWRSAPRPTAVSGSCCSTCPVPRPPGIYDRATGSLTAWNFTGRVGAISTTSRSPIG